jgi:nitrate reductase gamma subunit
MHENLNQWNFVVAAYVLGVSGTIVMIGWAWLSMRRAETKRDRSREK